MTQQNSMRFRPVIRVFVSSTFSDLKPERNALQAQGVSQAGAALRAERCWGERMKAEG